MMLCLSGSPVLPGGRRAMTQSALPNWNYVGQFCYLLVPFPQFRMVEKINQEYFYDRLVLVRHKICSKILQQPKNCWQYKKLSSQATLWLVWLLSIPFAQLRMIIKNICQQFQKRSSQVADLKLRTTEKRLEWQNCSCGWEFLFRTFLTMQC